MMEFTEDIERSLQVLRTGGIILYPTDTIWGIGCDATNPLAVQRIFNLKNRHESKSMIVLLADQREVLKYAGQADLRVFDYLKQVTKPTTVIYEGAIGLAQNLISKDGTVGIRVVSEAFCKNLIKRFRKPIVSTSANISGEPAPQYFDSINPIIKEGVDYMVEYRRSDKVPQEPSAVVRWNKDASITVIRP